MSPARSLAPALVSGQRVTVRGRALGRRIEVSELVVGLGGEAEIAAPEEAGAPEPPVEASDMAEERRRSWDAMLAEMAARAGSSQSSGAGMPPEMMTEQAASGSDVPMTFDAQILPFLPENWEEEFQ